MRRSHHIKYDGMIISRNEGEIELPKAFHITMFVQTKDDKGIKGATDESCKMVAYKMIVRIGSSLPRTIVSTH